MPFTLWLQNVLGLRSLPLGVRGERHAAKFLKSQGFRIIARNRTHRRGEIDLIAIEGDALVFVEVRTRRSEGFVSPETSIRYPKRKALAATARRLLNKHKAQGLKPRIDVVAIVWPHGAKTPTIVRHHRNAISLNVR